MRRTLEGVGIVLWALCLAVYLRDGGGLPSITKPAPTAATYVYEKDDGEPTAEVLSAINALNSLGINANLFDDDTRDGKGEVPDQYKAALISATEAGIPALVVTARNGDEVLRVVKAPTTAKQVLEAVK